MLLHFIEEALVASISIDLHPAVSLNEIPQDKRDLKHPKRFRLNLPGHFNEENI